jgi:hypothetical protein
MLLVLAVSPLRADPIVGSYSWDDPNITSSTLNYGAHPGELEVLTYNPQNWRAPGPGTLRFFFSPGETGVTTGNPGGIYSIAVQGFAFNTDLTLNPSQFNLPADWTATPNTLVPGLGRFSWVLMAPSPFFASTTGFDISGLGNYTTSNHFILPPTPDGTNSSSAWFAADIVPKYDPSTFSGPVPTVTDFWASASVSLPAATPEPSTLVLCGLGLGTWLGARAVRSRRYNRYILPPIR